MNKIFSVSEYQARLVRVRAAMLRHQLDAIFITAETNIFYFSGFRPVAPWYTMTRPNICLIAVSGDPILIVHDVWKGGATADTAWADVRNFSEMYEPPIAIVAEAFKDLGLTGARVGAELGYEQRQDMSPNDFGCLQDALPGVTWADGAAALWDVRMIKSPAEIAAIRVACKINADVFESCYSGLTPEMTEVQLASNLQAGIAKHGGYFGFLASCMVPDGYETMSRLPAARPLIPNTLIWNDIGSIYNGYWSDFGRAAVIGRATDRQKRMWEGVHAVTQAGIRAAGPGRMPGEIVAACLHESVRQGLEMNFASGRIGHGLGMLLTEPPHIAAYDQQMLHPGMVITLEPGSVGPEGVYIVEQNVAITESGTELLSTGRWQIWEI